MPRYNRRGQELVLFLPTLANPAAPSAAALNGATAKKVQPHLRSISGFTFTGEDLDASDMGSTWGKTIPGGDTAGDSSLTIYEGDADTDPETVLSAAMPKGTNGFIVFAPRGGPIVAGDPVDVWPIRVKSNNADKTAENATATRTIGMSVPDEPYLEVGAVI
ncbi:MAG: hypothetical protein M3522_09340 [Actinomycetota bacterium]|nr:hypothetical protein [Actinomycetota bacterium]